MDIPKNQFKVLALAPFGLIPEDAARIRLLSADRQSLDQAVAEIKPSIYLPVPQDLCPAGGLELAVESMKGFHPDLIVKKNPYLNSLLEARNYLADALIKNTPAMEIYQRLTQWKNLPLDLRPPAAAPAPAPTKSSPVDDILSLVAMPSAPAASGSAGGDGPKQWHNQLESTLSKLLSHLFASRELRTYEASWRGLEFALRQAPGAASITLTIGNITRELLETGLDDLQDQLISDPPSIIIIDLSFDNSQRNMELLERIANLGETLLTPVVVSIDQTFFGLEDWDGLHKLPYLGHLMDEAPWAKWRRLRKLGAANWLAVSVNQLLARNRYGKDNQPRLASFEEPHNLWLGSVWAPAALLVKRYAESGWATRIGEPQVARLTDLPLAVRPERPPQAAEADFLTERVHQFSEIGVMPVIAPANKDSAFIANAITVAGGSLAHQVILSRIIGLTLEFKERLDADIGPDALEQELKAGFTQWFNNVGPEAPADLTITVQENPGQPHLVSLSFTPPEKILPSGQKIELSLRW